MKNTAEPASATGMRRENTSVLVWLRNDLRLRDNPALYHGAEAAGKDGKLACVFLLAPKQWRKHSWSGVKVRLVLRSLVALREELAALNIPLIVRRADRFSDAPGVLVGLGRELGCSRLHFNGEYEVNERRRDEAVSRALEDEGVRVVTCHDQTVLAPRTVLTGAGKAYTVFTPFKKACVREIEERGEEALEPLPAPAKRREAVRVEDGVIPRSIDGFETGVDDELWPGGEREAQERLSAFLRGPIVRYADDRDFSGCNGTSTLSAYLSIGCISLRQCLHAAAGLTGGELMPEKKSLAGPAAWISELLWREFFRHLIAAYPRVSMGRAFRADTERIRWRDDAEGFERWCEGRTGVPLVDAGMRQMLRTGWMHNRLRMVTAMYLCKSLLIDWRLGEEHFMRHLVDGDLAQNNGNWQWCASTGADCVPYFRVFNPALQMKRYDPCAEFVREQVEELRGLNSKEVAGMLAGRGIASDVRERIGYPEEMVDQKTARARVMKAFAGRA